MKSGVPQTLGAKIRALRIERGLTQGELTRGEITAGLISQIESDRVAPSFRVIQLLAEQLGIQPHELITDVESRNLQLQILKEARDYLHVKKGEIALALLQQLASSQSRYISDAELYLEMAYAKQLIGQFDEALDLYATVEHEALLQSDAVTLADCMTRQGDLYMQLGKLPLALYSYKKALHFLQMQPNATFLEVYNLRKNISILLYRAGNIKQALHFAESSLSDLQADEHAEQLAETYTMLSVLYAGLTQRDSALYYAKAAISQYESLNLTIEALDASLNYAMILRELGDCEAALAFLIPVLAHYYDWGIREGLAQVWLERGDCECALQQYDDASRSLERAVALLAPNTIDYAQSLLLQGKIAAATGSFAKAVKAYDEALTILENQERHVTSIQILQALEQIYMELGEPKKALKSRERALALTAKTEQTRLIMSTIA
ncbi:tetratricopeptide repeat protein [Sulfoacidibacillus thermotolerans]|uniref:HTH cro/C1-type domain-containing protein n=1 Tax=Sulfoacidibacillus thermotolerans TaxID=1765684 RepID=A0A2U3D6U6_SULT2|nr:tetratricopeptide repeat protein [Sulfoacidibacillus thermotolerans]PWI56973.1 hypothetical protein BM613_10840 [Sulfoacidibacillus thermotolerans]